MSAWRSNDKTRPLWDWHSRVFNPTLSWHWRLEFERPIIKMAGLPAGDLSCHRGPNRRMNALLAASSSRQWKGSVREFTPWVAPTIDTTRHEVRRCKPLDWRRPRNWAMEMCIQNQLAFLQKPGWAPGVQYPIVIKRTPKSEAGQTTLFQEQGYKYWGVLSFRGLYPQTPQEILEFHQGRGNMENFIREGKINYDLKHFPCQSLKANHVYGLLALVAHNFLRAMAVLMRPDKPHFAKKLRRRMIHIPGHFVKGSGYFRMKIPFKFYEEVMAWMKRWSETFKPARDFSTA